MNLLRITLLLFIGGLFLNFKPKAKTKMYKKLNRYCATLAGEFDQISEQRKVQLKEIGDYIAEKSIAKEPVNLTVICTHNSRRSHIGQLFLKTAAVYYGVEKLATFSGGTEATAFNPRAVKALSSVGFKISPLTSAENPNYAAKMGRNYPSMLLFSKKYSHTTNPQADFAAIMVCSEADAACPLVPGADARFAIPYKDPKHSDNTPSESTTYQEKCREIGREMFFAMHYAKQKISGHLEETKAAARN
ncbi:MAG: protein-tyrosine-phosphatase [Bacteroidota bacterium]